MLMGLGFVSRVTGFEPQRAHCCCVLRGSVSPIAACSENPTTSAGARSAVGAIATIIVHNVNGTDCPLGVLDALTTAKETSN